MKKVEGIKSALTLVLNIIHLAKEQTSKSPSNSNYVIANQTTASNRFRKIVESVVQANRMAIEKAQKEDDENPTEKRRQYDTSIQRWRKPPNDTATWLYRLVFSSGPLPTSRPSQYDGATVVTIQEDNALSEPSDGEYESAAEKAQVVRFGRGSKNTPDTF